MLPDASPVEQAQAPDSSSVAGEATAARHKTMPWWAVTFLLCVAVGLTGFFLAPSLQGVGQWLMAEKPPALAASAPVDSPVATPTTQAPSIPLPVTLGGSEIPDAPVEAAEDVASSVDLSALPLASEASETPASLVAPDSTASAIMPKDEAPSAGTAEAQAVAEKPQPDSPSMPLPAVDAETARMVLAAQIWPELRELEQSIGQGKDPLPIILRLKQRLVFEPQAAGSLEALRQTMQRMEWVVSRGYHTWTELETRLEKLAIPLAVELRHPPGTGFLGWLLRGISPILSWRQMQAVPDSPDAMIEQLLHTMRQQQPLQVEAAATTIREALSKQEELGAYGRDFYLWFNDLDVAIQLRLQMESMMQAVTLATRSSGKE